MNDTENQELAQVARLLGALLQRELNAGLVRVWTRGGVSEALARLSLPLPDPSDEDALEELAAEYFALFIAPKDGPPPIQSIVESGTYEGEAASNLRRIVEQLGLERDPEAARGAPVDHLGSELEIWAEILERAPRSASDFARGHLLWSLPLLRLRGLGEGFYPSLCRVTADFIEEVAS